MTKNWKIVSLKQRRPLKSSLQCIPVLVQPVVPGDSAKNLHLAPHQPVTALHDRLQ